MSKKKIVSLGWFGHHNCGDEAFKDALQILFPEVEFIFISNLRANIDLINRNDYLLVGGGNIVSKEFLKGLELVKKPYSFIGVGLTPDSHLEVLSKAELVLVRDFNSTRLYRDAIYTPDISFGFTSDKEKGKELLEKIPYWDPNKKTVGVFLNDCVSARFDSTILKFVEAEKAKLELARFLENLPYNIIFIPMSFAPPDDRRISLDVVGKMFKGYKYTTIVNPLRPLDCLSLAANLDFAITMRLHASIFCTISGVPFIDLLHHSKNKGYLESIGLSQLGVDYYELSIKSLTERFAYLEEKKIQISTSLEEITKANKRLLREAITNVHLPQKRQDSCCQ